MTTPSLQNSLFSIPFADIFSFPSDKRIDKYWTVNSGEVHLAAGLCGAYRKSLTSWLTSRSYPLVSFEEASRIIEEERYNDNSEFMEGGIDPGRSTSEFLGLDVRGTDADLITLCGIQDILGRGLKYLSTGEMRRTLMYKALSSQSSVIVLDNPLDGLDASSRSIVLSLLQDLPRKNVSIIITAEDAALLQYASHVLYSESDGIPHIKTAEDFLKTHITLSQKNSELQDDAFGEALKNSGIAHKNSETKDELVRMNNVTVQWDGRKVLDAVNWTVHKGEHTLVQGKNGCGKTTLLELITGDNQQVYANDVYLFGLKRGSGETIWDIKAKLGIVSYKLHLEYRLVHGYTACQVVISGFYDSIGLYTVPHESECTAARRWLEILDLESIAGERFSDLSYGIQRSVLIIRAVVKCPPLLILDEPCHSLDAYSRNFVLQLLEKIASTGKTTLIHVTHDPEEILPCEKILFQFKPGGKPMYEVKNLHV